jgi:hypothetical protein
MAKAAKGPGSTVAAVPMVKIEGCERAQSPSFFEECVLFLATFGHAKR